MRLGWLAATRNSWNGLVHAVRHERPARQEAIVLVAALLLVPFLADSMRHAILLLGAVVLTLVVELLNVAIERLADRITLERDEAVRIAKDVGSAAVTLTVVLALALWLEAAWSALA